ncbi:hypothetical protein GGI15_003039 [Coemansia interrupta]|uniref:PIN domain-containing protein n=1 Tax=Coemansia interrupta TaxID=1126814 RepID=A0A9W8HI59_9FUNG|nr:hypothetical protein GGI15_003039 [Coemansia interrupta]
MVSGDLLDVARMVAVVDTNYFLSNLSLIRALSSRALSRGLVIVVPSAVFQELDGLKLSTKINMSTQGLKDVSTLARAATRFLDENLGHPGNALRGQKVSEWLRQEQINDDKILDCCLYFIEKHKLPVAILSEDRSLNVKARANGCATCGQWTKDASSLISEIEKLLLGTGRKVATVETNSVPNWSSTQSKAGKQHKHQKTVVVAGQTRVIAPLKTGRDPQPRETEAEKSTSKDNTGNSDSEWEQTGSLRVKIRKVLVSTRLRKTKRQRSSRSHVRYTPTVTIRHLVGHSQDPRRRQKQTNVTAGPVFGSFSGAFTFEMPLDLSTRTSELSTASPAVAASVGTNGHSAGYGASSNGLSRTGSSPHQHIGSSAFQHSGMEVDSDFEDSPPAVKPSPRQITAAKPLKPKALTPVIPATPAPPTTKPPLPNIRNAPPPPHVTVSLPNSPVTPSVSSATHIPPSSPASVRTPKPPSKQPPKSPQPKGHVQKPGTRTSSNGPSIIYIDDVVTKDPKALKTAIDVSADIVIYIRSKSDCSITDMLIDELKAVNLKAAFKLPPWTSTTTILTIILFYRDRLEKTFPGRIFSAIEHSLPWVMQLEGVSTCPFTTAPLPHNLSFAPLPVPAESMLSKDVKRQTEETAKLFSMASRLLAQCLCNENRRQEKKRHEHHKRWDAWLRDNGSAKSRSPSV